MSVTRARLGRFYRPHPVNVSVVHCRPVEEFFGRYCQRVTPLSVFTPSFPGSARERNDFEALPRSDKRVAEPHLAVRSKAEPWNENT